MGDAGLLRAAHAREQGQARDIAHVFNNNEEDDAAEIPAKTSGLQTLSSLLTGRQGLPDGMSAASAGSSAGAKHLCISRLPAGTTESAVRLECARHGPVSSVTLEADSGIAYVTFASADLAYTASQRLAGRAGLFGGSNSEPPQVKLTSDIPNSMRMTSAIQSPLVVEEPVDPERLPAYLRPREDRKRKRSRSRRHTSRSKSRKKRRSRSNKRNKRASWLDRSRSNSRTATGQYIRATGCSSTVRWWERKKASSSSSGSSDSGQKTKKRSIKAADEAELKRPRQVAVKGNWAQFVQGGSSYYYNVLTGKTTWERPNDFDAGPSRRASADATAALEASKARPTSCFL